MLLYNIISQKFVQVASKINCYLIPSEISALNYCYPGYLCRASGILNFHLSIGTVDSLALLSIANTSISCTETISASSKSSTCTVESIKFGEVNSVTFTFAVAVVWLLFVKPRLNI